MGGPVRCSYQLIRCLVMWETYLPCYHEDCRYINSPHSQKITGIPNDPPFSNSGDKHVLQDHLPLSFLSPVGGCHKTLLYCFPDSLEVQSLSCPCRMVDMQLKSLLGSSSEQPSYRLSYNSLWSFLQDNYILVHSFWHVEPRIQTEQETLAVLPIFHHVSSNQSKIENILHGFTRVVS